MNDDYIDDDDDEDNFESYEDDKDVKYNKQHSFWVIANVVRWHLKQNFVMEVRGFYLNDGLSTKFKNSYYLLIQMFVFKTTFFYKNRVHKKSGRHTVGQRNLKITFELVYSTKFLLYCPKTDAIYSL